MISSEVSPLQVLTDHRSSPESTESPPRKLLLARNLLERNDLQAVLNRQRFAHAGVKAVNLLSSPGSGKTALLEALARWAPAWRQAVVVGDLATDHDARRLQSTGLTAVQINTGQGCHLEASQVARAIDQLEADGTALAQLDWLWIENVGNLVCPAAYDLGESLRLVLLSTTEGEDKPLKYPSLFHSADLVLISKVDLAEVVGFDRQAALAAIARVAPRAQVLEISARSGSGLEPLLAWLQSRSQAINGSVTATQGRDSHGPPQDRRIHAFSSAAGPSDHHDGPKQRQGSGDARTAPTSP